MARRYLLSSAILTVVLLTWIPAFAATCTSATLHVYDNAGASDFSCTDSTDTWTFSNFSFSILSQTGSPTVLTDSQIDILASSVGGLPVVTITPDAGGPGFSVTNNQEVVYHIGYFIDAPPVIGGQVLEMLGSDPPSFGVVTITQYYCLGTDFPQQSNEGGCDELTGQQVVSTDGGSVGSNLLFQTPQNGLGVHTVIDLNTLDNQDIAAISGGIESDTISGTPEPSAAILTLAGLGFVAILRVFGRRTT